MGKRKKKHITKRCRKYNTKGEFKGVYPKGKGYRAVTWEPVTGYLSILGTYKTEEEADYMRRMEVSGHHWKHSHLLDDSPKAFGFIYQMTERSSGKKYIGSKQLYFWDGPRGGYKDSDPRSKWFDKKAWRESDWRTYAGSSKDILTILSKGNPWDFSYEIVEVLYDKLELHLAEIRHQMKYDVLDAKDSKGNYTYFNKNISGCLFRPPYSLEEAKVLRKKAEEDARNYYLKPITCGVCSQIIPYGESKCPVCDPKVEASFG